MRFSIIVPVYNARRYLSQCLQSILCQEFSDWECICIDDGSTDGSVDVLEEYAQMDGRFKVVRQENAGVCAARNRGLDLASGDYVGFVDSDDEIAEKWLSTASELLEKTEAEILRLSFTTFNEGENPPGIDEAWTYRQIVGVDAVRDWRWYEFYRHGQIAVVFIKRKGTPLASQTRFPIGMRVWEDMAFLLRYLTWPKSACQSDYAGYYYRIRSSSAAHKYPATKDAVRFLDEMIGAVEEQKMHGLDMSHAVFSRIVEMIENNDAETAFVYLRRSIQCGIASVSLVPHGWRLFIRLCLLTNLRLFLTIGRDLHLVWHKVKLFWKRVEVDRHEEDFNNIWYSA